MSNRRRQQASPGVRRRVLTAPVAVIGAGGLVVWGIGAADAATGGTFVLGKANSETSTATLTNTHGIPLSLKAKSGSPPLTVNSSKLVARLNAAEVGGLSASKLQRRLGSSTCPTGIGHVTATGGVTCAHDQLIFTSSGSFTVPANVTHMTGEIWGGGGGGGYYQYADGGGSGGFVEVLINVTPGQTYDVNIGAGGAAATAVAPGQGVAGGTSNIGKNGVVLADATGGTGGAACGTPAAGGQGEVFTNAGVIGLARVTGDTGDCEASGNNSYFAGAGGRASVYAQYAAGSAGQPGLALISFSS